MVTTQDWAQRRMQHCSISPSGKSAVKVKDNSQILDIYLREPTTYLHQQPDCAGFGINVHKHHAIPFVQEGANAGRKRKFGLLP